MTSKAPTEYHLKLMRESLYYDGEVLFWKEERPLNHFKNRQGYKTWKGRVAGRPAGSVKPDKRTSYLRLEIGGRHFYAHRVAWYLFYGVWPNMSIDHINGDGLDNTISNLRLVTTSENAMNSRLSSRSSTGFSGVHPTENGGYRVRGKCTETGKMLSLGSFENIEDAIAVREKFLAENGYSDRHGRAPQSDNMEV